MAAAELKQGQRVRFTSEQLGVVDPSVKPTRFVADSFVHAGDEGVVAIPAGTMPDGWIAVTPDKFPDYYAPVHPGMVEAI